jgi:hypothetical protein
MSAYTIKLTNGQDLVLIQDATSDTTKSSLTLFGKNFAGYGQPLNENLVKMLENFSLSAPPQNPLTGQLWWNSQHNQLNVFRGTWKVVSGPTASATAPFSDTTGDLWWDTTDQQLKSFNGTEWSLVGPMYKTSQGINGPVTGDIIDSNGYMHTVVKFYASGVVIGVLATESFPIALVDLPGLHTISPGINLIPGMTFVGTATDANKLGGIDAAGYLRSDIDDTTSGKLGIRSNSGLTVGLNDDLQVSIAGSAISFDSVVAGRDIKFSTVVSGALTPALVISGSSGRVSVMQSPLAATDVTNKSYVDTSISTTAATMLRADGTVPITGSLIIDQNDAFSLGTSNSMFRNIYSKNVFASTVDAAFGSFATVQINGAIVADNTATTKLYVDTAVNAVSADMVVRDQQLYSSIVGFPGGGLTTIASLATAVNNDPAFATTINDAINTKAPLFNAVFTSTPRAPAVTNSADSTDKLATTSFVHLVTDTLSNNVTSSLTGYAPLNSPVFINGTTSRPSSTNANLGDETLYPTQIATLSYVATKIANSVGTSVAAVNNTTLTGNTAITNLTVTGPSALKDVTINGNLTVVGTMTTLNVATLDVADLNITLARNATTPTAADGAGVTINGANATMIYTSANDSWNFNKTVTAPLFNGVASSAQYADLAENYVADAQYEPGTVLDFGGDKEVTLSDVQHPTRVAGVVSSNPAYLMNTTCQGEFVVALALQGRVPCKVIGYIQKGDILVSNGNGEAKRSLDPKPGTIIGKALEAHNGDTSLIEIAVGRG